MLLTSVQREYRSNSEVEDATLTHASCLVQCKHLKIVLTQNFVSFTTALKAIQPHIKAMRFMAYFTADVIFR